MYFSNFGSYFVGYRRRQWHPTPVLLPGKSHGQRSLEGCSPWGRWGSNMTEWLHFHFSLSCIGEGNGNPLQCSCLENPRDEGAWWAAVFGVAQSQTRLKRLSSSRSSINTHTHSNPIKLCHWKLKMNSTTTYREKILLPLLIPLSHFSLSPKVHRINWIKVHQINWIKTFPVNILPQRFSKCGQQVHQQVLGLHPWPTESESLEAETHQSVFLQSLQRFCCT